MKKIYNIMIFLISLLLIISLSYNIHLLNKIKSEDAEKNIVNSSYMKIHLLEFYQDIQKYSSFVVNEEVENLMQLIDSMKEQRTFYMRISKYDLQVAYFFRRYIKIVEEYRDSILFGKKYNEKIKIESIVKDIKIINNWLYERGKKDNLEVYNLNEIIGAIGKKLELTNYID